MLVRPLLETQVLTYRTEAFHYIFTHTLSNLLIHLILSGTSPQFLRRKVVHGGPALDHMFQAQMLERLYQELEDRLSGMRISDLASKPLQPNAPPVSWPRDGVCFHSLTYQHGLNLEDDDHGTCLCQLTQCLECFGEYAQRRRGPVGLLPYKWAKEDVVHGWSGGIETLGQARARADGMRPVKGQRLDLPEGKGFVQNPKTRVNGHEPLPPPMFPHPQMTDILAVEEHIRWRLKEMGASDPAVEARYGPSTNSPAAMEGIEIPNKDDEASDEGSVKPSKAVKVTRTKGKVRRVVNGGKKDQDKKTCYLPPEWTEADAAERNTAIVLTFRHFVKVSPCRLTGPRADRVVAAQDSHVCLAVRV